MNFLSLADEVFVETTVFVETLKNQGAHSVLSRIERNMRRLHNLKGISGVFSLKDFRAVIHDMETQVGEAKGEGVDLCELVCRLEDSVQIFNAEKTKTHGVFATMPAELRRRLLGVVFSQQEFESLKCLIEEESYPKLSELIASVERIDSKKLIEQWPQEAKKIADVLGKSVQFQVMGEGGLITKDLFLELDKVLIHLLRNALDHGLEKPEERVKKGKTEQGNIEVTIDVPETDFVMLVEDDGHGIDNDALVKRARQNKNFAQAQIDQYVASGEIWRILLMSGFSTAKEVTDLSGRGVGLDSVANAIEKLGGTLTIESDFGKGTRFLIMIPL
jgi:chemotaxis protein histidine kinase CheA